MAREKKYKVLVVDDEDSVLLTYRLILQQEGYDVTACDTAETALQAIDELDFDLLLCDLSLEAEANGFDVIARGRERKPGVPAAILTGYATREAADFADKNQITILFKPIDIQEFLNTTSSLLRGKYAVSKEASNQEKNGQEHSGAQRREGADRGSRTVRTDKK